MPLLPPVTTAVFPDRRLTVATQAEGGADSPVRGLVPRDGSAERPSAAGSNRAARGV
jgi:hypothetical protein